MTEKIFKRYIKNTVKTHCIGHCLMKISYTQVFTVNRGIKRSSVLLVLARIVTL